MHGVICRYLGFCRYAQHPPDNDIQIIFLDVGHRFCLSKSQPKFAKFAQTSSAGSEVLKEYLLAQENVQSDADAYVHTISTIWNCLSVRPFLEAHDANTRAKVCLQLLLMICSA